MSGDVPAAYAVEVPAMRPPATATTARALRILLRRVATPFATRRPYSSERSYSTIVRTQAPIFRVKAEVDATAQRVAAELGAQHPTREPVQIATEQVRGAGET